MINAYLTSSDYEKILTLVLQLSNYQLSHNKEDYCLHILQCLYDYFGYRHMTFLQADSKANFIKPIALNISPSLCTSYDDYYKDVDIFSSSHIDLRYKKFIAISDLMSFSDYEKTEYYNDFLRRANLYYEIALPLTINNTYIGGIGIFKTKDEGNFSLKDHAILSCLSEHISAHFNNFNQYKLKENYSSLLIKKDFPLTKRETEIALLVKQGLSNEAISNTLHISFHTVKTHLEHIYKKLGISNRAGMLHKLNDYKL